MAGNNLLPVSAGLGRGLGLRPVRTDRGRAGGAVVQASGLRALLFLWIVLPAVWGLPVLEVMQPLALKGGVGWSHRYVNVCSLSVAVMGQKVNLAARLMEHYPGLVSCDAATYAASRLPRSYFKELPEAKMKGVVDPGTVYQYLGISEEP